MRSSKAQTWNILAISSFSVNGILMALKTTLIKLESIPCAVCHRQCIVETSNEQKQNS